MYNEDTMWFNQSLFFFKDQLYGSLSSFEISISTNSADFKRFSAPTLFLSIQSDSDRSKRFNILNYTDIVDLTIKLRRSLKNPELAFKQGTEIYLKYNNGKSLKVQFIESQSMNNEWLVVFEIRHNDSDFGKIIMPFSPVFMSLVKKFESYINNCDQMSISMVNRALFSNMIDKLQGIENAIKIIPSQIQTTNISNESYINHKESYDSSLNQNPPKTKSQVEPETETISIEVQKADEVTKNETVYPEEVLKKSVEHTVQNEFDSFMNDNIDKVDVPEIDKDDKVVEDKEKSFEIDSPLAEKVLNWDLMNLENVLYALITRESPFVKFNKMIETDIGFETLPDMTEEEEKTFTYISGLMFHTLLQNYSRNNAAFPPTVPVLSYEPKKCDIQNKILAIDVLMINAYLKLMRSKVESKVADAMENKAILHIAFRCFADPLLFAFIHKEDKNTIVGTVKERFKAFKAKGFFTKYDEYIKSYGLTEITLSEISNFVNSMIDNVLGKIPTILENLKGMKSRNEALLDSIDKYSLEQINELIKAEVEVKLANYEAVKDKFDDEITAIIDSARNVTPAHLKPTKKNGVITKDPNVYKYVYSYRNEIPKEYQDKLLDVLKNIGKNKFDWSGFPIDEIGDRVIIALYCWNNSSRSESYKIYVSELVEQCAMTKDLIIVKVKEELQTETRYQTEDEWSCL